MSIEKGFLFYFGLEEGFSREGNKIFGPTKLNYCIPIHYLIHGKLNAEITNWLFVHKNSYGLK
jgi:hypothetical protein